jgi:hypothetical protein
MVAIDSTSLSGNYSAGVDGWLRDSSSVTAQTNQPTVAGLPQSKATDTADISPLGRQIAEAAQKEAAQKEAAQKQSGQGSQANADQSASQQKEIAELKETDRKVRAHEMAHLAAAGGLVRGGMSFSYKTGPDGVRYAVGGEVSIDTSPVADDPQATVRKAERIRRAALAPADPSPQDRKVATQADAMMRQAQMEEMQQKQSGGVTNSKNPQARQSKLKHIDIQA